MKKLAIFLSNLFSGKKSNCPYITRNNRLYKVENGILLEKCIDNFGNGYWTEPNEVSPEDRKFFKKYGFRGLLRELNPSPDKEIKVNNKVGYFTSWR